MTLRRYSKEEDEFISSNCESMTLRELATKLNRHYGSVQARLKYLGLKSKGHALAHPSQYTDVKALLDRLFYDSDYERKYRPPFRHRNEAGI